jgi:hypothetical protein
VLVDTDYWKGLIQWIDEKLVAEQKISPQDMEIFQLVDTAAEAVSVIEEFYKKYALKPNF